MKILFLLHYFQPEPNFFYGLPMAEELARRGHQVQVLTGFPNYPGGKIYPGYRQKLFMRETMNDIPVTRVPLYPSHDRSSLKRIISYCTLSASQAFLGPWMMKKADVAYVVQGPATLGLPATLFKWFKRTPFVYHIQDLWPDSLTSTGMFNSSHGINILHRWCNFVYNQAARIIVIAPGMKSRLIERGVPHEKINLIYNWCDETMTNAQPGNDQLKTELGMQGKFNVVFAGNMGKAQALEAVLKAASILKNDYPQIQFVMIGSGVEVENLKNYVQQNELSNVIFHGRKTVTEIGAILPLADILLVHLRNDSLFDITVPSKTQAYLSMGRPIVIGVRGDAAHLVQQAQAGLTCEPENPNSIAKAILDIYQMPPNQREKMGRNGREFYQKEITFQIGVDRFEKQFELAAGK